MARCLWRRSSGGHAGLPADLPALVHAFAAIHRLPLPAREARPPLLDPDDALGAALGDIEAQAVHLAGDEVPQDSRRRIEAVLHDVHGRMSDWQAPPQSLIAFDAHPGNFLVCPDGRAVLVDLEKGRYGLPALDVAHATLYTSTTWDLAHRVALNTVTIAEGYLCWQAALGRDAAGSPDSWQVLRKVMWLWSVTWCAKWLAMAPRPADARTSGEDWSAALSAEPLVAHVRERVEHYLSEAIVNQVVSGFDELAASLAT